MNDYRDFDYTEAYDYLEKRYREQPERRRGTVNLDRPISELIFDEGFMELCYSTKNYYGI